MASEVSIHLDGSATPEEVQGVRAACEAAGLDADVDTGWRKPTRYAGMGNGPVWIVAAVLALLLRDFLGGFAGESGADAWRTFKK
jgi:hypothetical protein